MGIEEFDKGFESAWSRMEKYKGVPVEQLVFQETYAKTAKPIAYVQAKTGMGISPDQNKTSRREFAARGHQRMS